MLLVCAMVAGVAGASEASPDDSAKVATNHWSLQPLRDPTVPAIEAPAEASPNPAPTPLPLHAAPHPIDAFVLERLKEHGLAPAPPADRATLIRRLSFDLTGLPPSPQDVTAFVRDRSQRAYEDLVDRLLASPHYGERWGRHWLDLARFTESQGFEYDRLRDHAWHYRDYVIRSFNDDKPYDRFMMEQIAGDVLEPVTSDGIVAASLLVCGPWDQAGNSQANATQKAITREEEMEDMISVVGQTFLGLTVNCARCHTHKFDPITLEDYYRFKAVFDGVKHGERPIEDAAQTEVREARAREWNRSIDAARADAARLEAEGWKRAAAQRGVPASDARPVPVLAWQFHREAGRPDPAGLQGGAVMENGRLRLAKPGAFFRSAPIPRDLREKTLEAWVALADLNQGGGAAISIETEDGRVFDAIVYGERQPGRWMAGSSGFERTRDLDVPKETAGPGELIHMAAVYGADGGIQVFRNGEPYGKRYTPDSPLQTYRASQARVLLGMRHTGGGRPFLTGDIQQAALYDRALTDAEIAASFRSSEGSIPQAEALAALTDAERLERDAALARADAARESLKQFEAAPVSYAGTRVQPDPTRVLHRGDVTSPGEVVSAAGLSGVQGPDPDFGLAPHAPEAARRLKLARWLADTRNPLPARVMANRVWQYHFGEGLVRTPSDFGASGGRPSHPELLDWLAIRFMESGWSVKALHRLILHSATYRQSSRFNDRAAELDAENRLLWRFTPRRIEAEILRDAILAVSGEINLEMGGPSFRPFDILPFPANTYAIRDKVGPDYNRRTVYRMNVNSGKEPLLDAFDCPDPAVKTPRRGVTTTPLQALGLMNNAFVRRQAGRFAERAMEAGGPGIADAVRQAYWLALGREPTPGERLRAEEAAGERGLESVCWALLNSTEFLYVQ